MHISNLFSFVLTALPTDNIHTHCSLPSHYHSCLRRPPSLYSSGRSYCGFIFSFEQNLIKVTKSTNKSLLEEDKDRICLRKSTVSPRIYLLNY